VYQDFGTGDDTSPSDGEGNFEIKQDLISEQGITRASVKWLNADLLFLIPAIAVPDKEIEQIDHREEASSERESIAKKGISR